MNSDFSKTIILVPTYNEKGNIGILVKMLFDLYPQSALMIIDDHSPDGTAEAVQEAQKNYPRLFLYSRLTAKGFGRSYLDGFKKILADDRFDRLVMMDADLSHDPLAIGPMLARLKDYGVVNGSRYVSGGGVKNWKLSRRVLSFFANFYVRTILGVPIRDLTTGFVCMRKEVLRKISLSSIYSDGYAFLVELKYRLWKAEIKIAECPIIYTERREGQSKMSRRVIWESIWLPWKLRFGLAKSRFSGPD